jgi:hypothetical protein
MHATVTFFLTNKGLDLGSGELHHIRSTVCHGAAVRFVRLKC